MDKLKKTLSGDDDEEQGIVAQVRFILQICRCVSCKKVGGVGYYVCPQHFYWPVNKI